MRREALTWTTLYQEECVCMAYYLSEVWGEEDSRMEEIKGAREIGLTREANYQGRNTSLSLSDIYGKNKRESPL